MFRQKITLYGSYEYIHRSIDHTATRIKLSEYSLILNIEIRVNSLQRELNRKICSLI